MGSLCKMAFWNKLSALGVANSARTIVAPLLCPAIVIFDVSPLKLGSTLLKNCSALIMSFTARFVSPLGAMNPN